MMNKLQMKVNEIFITTTLYKYYIYTNSRKIL